MPYTKSNLCMEVAFLYIGKSFAFPIYKNSPGDAHFVLF